jgi:hypothetical protein
VSAQAFYDAVCRGVSFAGMPKLQSLVAHVPGTDGRRVVGSAVAQCMDAQRCCNASPSHNVLASCKPGDQVMYLMTLGVDAAFRCVQPLTCARL